MVAPRLTAEDLFRTYFWPLYPADAQGDLLAARTTDANPARNLGVLAHLDEAAQLFAARAHVLFGTDLKLDFSDESVHRLSAAITRERREGWRAHGEAGTASSELFNVVVHGAAYVGACAIKGREDAASWSVRRPLWESLVSLRSRAGEGDLAVFHWWLKSLADDAFEGSGHTVADRYRAHVELPTMRPEELPILAPSTRKLPRISKARYDVLYKHLKAHLPEIKDLGADFPSPERFAEMGFTWLDFVWVGEGRMLVMYGPAEGGVHLFWLDAHGFQKAAFFPADKFPEPIVRTSGEKIQVLAAVLEKPIVHEMLWWGP